MKKPRKCGTKSKNPRKATMVKCDKIWGLLVRERDKHTCQKCGRPGNNPHHIFSRRHLATRWDLANGMTLCWACHMHSDAEVLRDIALKMVGEHGFFRLKMMALIPTKVDVGMVEIGLHRLMEERNGNN